MCDINKLCLFQNFTSFFFPKPVLLFYFRFMVMTSLSSFSPTVHQLSSPMKPAIYSHTSILVQTLFLSQQPANWSSCLQYSPSKSSWVIFAGTNFWSKLYNKTSPCHTVVLVPTACWKSSQIWRLRPSQSGPNMLFQLRSLLLSLCLLY